MRGNKKRIPLISGPLAYHCLWQQTHGHAICELQQAQQKLWTGLGVHLFFNFIHLCSMTQAVTQHCSLQRQQQINRLTTCSGGG